MGFLFLTTVLSCNQVIGIVNRLQNISLLTVEQRKEILIEIHKVAKTCPIIIKPNDSKTKAGN